MTRAMQVILTRIPQSRKSNLPASLRKTRDELAYVIAKKAGKSRPLHEEKRLMEWSHWALIDNQYPYTAAFKVHHMLIPKRVVSEKRLTDEERSELASIINQLEDIYDCQLVNFNRKQSIKDHYHIHLLAYKDLRRDLGF